MIEGDLVRLSDVSRRYVVNNEERIVLNGADFSVPPGVILGIRGDSGIGKTTLARILVGLDQEFTGARILARELTSREIQLVFQDSLQAFNPRISVGTSLTEALVASGKTRWRDVPGGTRREVMLEAALTEVGLEPHLMGRPPAQLSGGQRQRASIARALLMEPAVLVLDEPVAALDLSIQARILNLLREVHLRHRMSMVVISHDADVLAHLCDDTYNLKEGKIWHET